jgi:hypothetical protein
MEWVGANSALHCHELEISVNSVWPGSEAEMDIGTARLSEVLFLEI